MAAIWEDQQVCSLKQGTHRKARRRLLMKSMRLDPRDCSMLELHDVEALFYSWTLTPATFIRSRHGDWSEYIVLEDYCMEV
jgi:hypothetical protein